jgi:hypothetical protein
MIYYRFCDTRRKGRNGVGENVWTQGDEVAGIWRKLNIEELHNLYTSPNIIRVMK